MSGLKRAALFLEPSLEFLTRQRGQYTTDLLIIQQKCCPLEKQLVKGTASGACAIDSAQRDATVRWALGPRIITSSAGGIFVYLFCTYTPGFGRFSRIDRFILFNVSDSSG